MIEPAAPAIRRRFRAPPLPREGRGEPKAFRVDLWEGGATVTFIVAAYTRRQAAELLQVCEAFLRLHGRLASAAERERAELVPGQVWMRPPGAPSFTKWPGQSGLLWS